MSKINKHLLHSAKDLVLIFQTLLCFHLETEQIYGGLH
jgi:hypothetical protein